MKSRFLWLFLLTLGLGLVGSCSEPRPVNSVPQPGAQQVSATRNPQLDRQAGEIRDLTDAVLRCLATYDYQRLAQLLEPADRALSGVEVAEILLGPDARSMLLERWDARQIAVSFSDNGEWATAQTQLRYRRRPNRRARQALFSVRFHKQSPQGNWLLSVL